MSVEIIRYGLRAIASRGRGGFGRGNRSLSRRGTRNVGRAGRAVDRAQDAYNAYKEIQEREEQEAVVEEALDEMNGMVVNEGQETIIGLGEDPFREWAYDFFNDMAGPEALEGYLATAIYDEQYKGTEQIWDAGKALVANLKAEQSGRVDLQRLAEWMNAVEARDRRMGKGSEPDLNPDVPGFQWRARAGGSDITRSVTQ